MQEDLTNQTKTDYKPLSFSAIVVENLCDNIRFLGNLPTSRMRDDELLCVIPGLPTFDMNFACLRYEPPAKNLDELIKEAIDFFKVVNGSFYWWLTPGDHCPRLAEKLNNHGFQLVGEMPTMAADLRPMTLPDSLPKGYRLVEVTRKDELGSWADVAMRGFSFTEDTRLAFTEMVNHFLDVPIPKRPILFMAYLDDKPVAISMLNISQEIAGLYWVCTVPEVRRQGVGAAIVHDALRRAKKMGYIFACLQSTQMGYNLYQKLGFKEYFRIPLFLHKEIPTSGVPS